MKEAARGSGVGVGVGGIFHFVPFCEKDLELLQTSNKQRNKGQQTAGLSLLPLITSAEAGADLLHC
jgi:hypothetical protein